MVEKYGALTEVIWANDPIARQLKPELAASLHDEIFRLGLEAFDKPVKMWGQGRSRLQHAPR
jgi:hypothetical protein